ncbi:hypothetical protein OIU79_007740 [Salix purpurea]|uniref:Uncharacterized protein n=1 Tax=Salix purpurea TaxID=77065 RepID=A0A9Q0YVC8_SALPP|nr:hypothetical protein OIU79_007740 [Salix purpurea]
MEAAFWDSVMESMKQDEPKYEWVVQLVGEVRDGIQELAPESWKHEIVEAIDLDLLSQVLKSGNLDIGCCGKILEFALVTLQKLSSPAKEDEMKALHQKLLKELAETCQTQDELKHPHIAAMIKGLRSVLEQIQALKQEISKVRIRMMEPLLTGPAGLDYLRKAFANHYGSDLDACISLPLTMQWLSSVKNSGDQEWEEHQSSLFSLKSHDSSSKVSVPFTTLRTGGSFLVKTNGSAMGSPFFSFRDRYASYLITNNQNECTGERIDLLVRLGLLKIVSGVSGLTKETLPETFMLNLSRLRAVQAEIQKMIVISTSILVYRQSLLMERAVNSIAEMESILLERCNKLSRVLDRVDDVGIEEIVQVVGGFSQDDDEKHKPRKLVMARMLAKSLQAGDPVFEKVSRAVYLALRGIVLVGWLLVLCWWEHSHSRTQRTSGKQSMCYILFCAGYVAVRRIRIPCRIRSCAQDTHPMQDT